MKIFGLFKPDIKKMKAKRDVKGLVKVLGDADCFRVDEARDALFEIKESVLDPLIATIHVLNHGAFHVEVEENGTLGWYYLKRGETPQQVWNAREKAVDVLAHLYRLYGKGRNATEIVEVLLDSLRAFKEESGKLSNEEGWPLGENIWGNSSRWKYSSAEITVTRALADIGDRAVEPLIQALKDYWKGYAHEAIIKTLGMIEDAGAVEPLIKIYQNSSWEERREIIKALGEIRDARAVELLIRALKDKDDATTRRLAAESLGEIGDARAVEPLIEALEVEDEYYSESELSYQAEVRVAMVNALGRIGHSRAIEPLIQASNNWRWGLNVNAASAENLKKIQGK